ncbi:MAG TPA: hypothetical protein VJ992_02850 [Gemmatimonadales bacterium]|nr:hypothetical protein [Gemmatimonadales bacterium]
MSKCTCGESGGAVVPPGEAGRAGTHLCPRCGGQLRRADSADALLAKLSQLARFGLAAEDGPLLEPNYEGR